MNHWFESDEAFNDLLPESLKRVAARHWTPHDVAVKAAQFLGINKNEKVLDIGSGVGKFCLIAGHLLPNIQFVGVEQRANLVELSTKLAEELALQNVTFIHQNIADLDFEEYHHFYFYNSFYENIEGTEKIDYDIPYASKLYDHYNLILYKKLDKKPSGARLVTFHSLGNEVPRGYEIVQTDYDNYLQYYIKT